MSLPVITLCEYASLNICSSLMLSFLTKNSDTVNDLVKKSFNRIQVMYEELQTVGDPDLVNAQNETQSAVSNHCE